MGSTWISKRGEIFWNLWRYSENFTFRVFQKRVRNKFFKCVVHSNTKKSSAIYIDTLFVWSHINKEILYRIIEEISYSEFATKHIFWSGYINLKPIYALSYFVQVTAIYYCDNCWHVCWKCKMLISFFGHLTR